MADFDLTSPRSVVLLVAKWHLFFSVLSSISFMIQLMMVVNVSTIDTDCNLIINHFTKKGKTRHSVRRAREKSIVNIE